MSLNTISVVGLGYIGLPTAAIFASRGKRVIGVDVNQVAVDTVNRGEIHIVEPELDVIVRTVVSDGRLKAVTRPEPADAFLIAVPTPFKKSSGNIPEPDLAYIKSASLAIAPVLKKGDLLILESTSPVGTTEQVAKWLAESRPDLRFPQDAGEHADISVAYCPERVLPGRVVAELVENSRVIGGMTPSCTARAIELYKIFVEGSCVATDTRTAEMVKLTENSCRDVQIAFANELSMLCDQMEIDVWELIALANLHPRINILNPGPGVGGHCIAVDPWFIISQHPNDTAMMQAARSTNLLKESWIIEKVLAEIGNNSDAVNRPKVVFYGLTFKADIDDIRESPALRIALAIAEVGAAEVMAVEPNLEATQIEGIPIVTTKEAFVADIAVVLVRHSDFEDLALRDRYSKVLDYVGLI